MDQSFIAAVLHAQRHGENQETATHRPIGKTTLRNIMKPIDIRNATFASIQERLTADREKVWQGYRLHGPCTTRELADKIGMSLLTVRPRTTELYELGLVDCTGRGADGGIYEHVMLCVAQARWEARQAAESAGQLEMAFA